MLGVTHFPEMTLRFVIFDTLFVGLVAIQLLAGHFINGFGRIYVPFVHLVEPIVRTRYVGSSASLLAVVWGVRAGTFVYSAVLAFVGAFLTSSGLSNRHLMCNYRPALDAAMTLCLLFEASWCRASEAER